MKYTKKNAKKRLLHKRKTLVKKSHFSRKIKMPKRNRKTIKKRGGAMTYEEQRLQSLKDAIIARFNKMLMLPDEALIRINVEPLYNSLQTYDGKGVIYKKPTSKTDRYFVAPLDEQISFIMRNKGKKDIYSSSSKSIIGKIPYVMMMREEVEMDDEGKPEYIVDTELHRESLQKLLQDISKEHLEHVYRTFVDRQPIEGTN